MSIRYNLCKSGQIKGAFSLVELLIVIAVFSILVGLSVPTIHHLLQRYYFMQRYNQLHQALYYTKSMAILKKRNIEICGSDDGVHCIDDWNRYWIIRDAVSQNVLRRIQLEPIRHLSVTWHGNFKDRDGIYFNELGETGGQQGRFNLDLGVGHKEIVITLSGRMR